MQNSQFIFTDGAKSRIQTVVNGIKSGIPLLLEGETGTSKTATSKQAAESIGQHAIIFNFSSQTSVEDLLGRMSKSNDSWSGFSFIKGPYTEAFEKGYCIILDEINLAHETVLQCIESSLDSQTLSLDYSGNEVDKTIKMHKDFHLIATQNPLTNRFTQKRNFLSHKFTSRFQLINFGEISQEEMMEIALGLSQDIDTITPDFIKSLIKFHFEWQKNKFSFSSLTASETNSLSYSFTFTIREICRTIKSIKKGLTPFESIIINYGSRYNNVSKTEMKKLLNSLGIYEEYRFFNDCSYINEIKVNNVSEDPSIIETNKNQKFFMTNILENIFASSFHLLDNSQSILLVGPDGCGKTSIGRWIADLFSSYIRKNLGLEDNSDYKFFICNPEMTIADIIGRYVPCKQDQSAKDSFISESPIEWKYGPVVDALENGDCLILDQIDTAPSTILERLNSLFDSLGEQNFKLPIQENLENPEVLVDSKFRMIAISSLSGLNNLSPAFLNRFSIIYINEQLNFISRQLGTFIRCISPNSKSSLLNSHHIKFLEKEIRSLDKDKLTSLNVSKCVNGYFKLKKIVSTSSESEQKIILDFCFDAFIYHTTKIPKMSENFVESMLKYLDDNDEDSKQFDSFHFKEAQSTRNVMAALVACSIIGIHTILIGRTGLGKTAAAMAFARLNKTSSKSSSPHIISFNGETQLDELYGYFTIEKGNFSIHQGDLSQAMSEGQVFIADELNLADQQIIQSLNVAIEPSIGESIILPVTGTSLTIKKGFFFIGCQNDLTVNGRRPIPESIKKKIFCIDYPEPTKEDLIKLCTSIANQFGLNSSIPKCTASLMETINKDLTIKSWSLREVRILYKRIAYFQTKTAEFTGFTPLHHFAFMLISPFKGDLDMIERVATIVCQSFMQNDSIDSLIDDMKARVIVQKYINNTPVNQHYIDSMDKNDDKNDYVYSVKLLKGNLQLMIYNTQLFYIHENIQQLWQTIFDIYLTNQSEPLLFIGPSGFKTYLARLISSLAPIIYLHSDSTVSSLIGQITLLDHHQAKLSLLDSLYDFTGYNVSLKEPLNNLKMILEEADDINIDSLRSSVEAISKVLPESFIPIIDNVVNSLINLQNDEKNESNIQMFSNYISLFKPGLITKSILSQNSLVLKNFAQPSPAVIERLNELLSVTPTLTLFEDTSNTFTTPENNKLYGFSNVFRIIGICKPFEKRNLSDAMLSRLTEIHVPEYSSLEQESVFRNYIEYEHDKEAPILILNKAMKSLNNYNINVSFRQKIKIIQVANKWMKMFPEINMKTIYIISILRCAGGPLPFELKKYLFETMKKTFDSYEFPANFQYLFQIDKTSDALKNESCLLLNESDNNIVSMISNFHYPNISSINDSVKANPSIKFSSSLNDIIDVIFSFSTINYPIILEGPNGCGKSSAFFYVAKYLGVKVIQISLSRSTTVEDLFGRYEPNSESKSIQFEFKPTAFLNAIDNKRNQGEKYWILIEELDLASASVIDSLEPIFNPQSDHVTLPDGSFVQRGNFFVVGLMSKPLQKQSITNAALYYKVKNYTKDEIYEIGKFILERNNLQFAVKNICPLFSHLYEISSSSQIKIPITPRDAIKFVKMMKSAKIHSNENKALNDVEISQLLFLGRFYEDDLKEGVRLNINETLKRNIFTEFDEIPDFVSSNSGQIISSRTLSIKTLDTKSRHNEINNLTQSEKKLFEFLILNTEEYTPIVVQGPTASGKTYGVQLFADVIGKNLKVIQLNSEISSAYIADSYHPSKNLSPEDINELQKAFELLSGFVSNFPDKFRSKILRGKINEWQPSEFYEMKKIVEKLLTSGKLNEDDSINAREFISKVNSILLFISHLERNDSVIIKALTEGDWLLLDGIESAPSDFLDRLSTLLDDPPILNLYERGGDCVYSTNPDSNGRSKKIHPDFRLFMTFNPVGTFANSVSSSFLSRCSIYSMNSIDSNLYDSSVFVLGLVQKVYLKFIRPSELSARISNVHVKMKVKDKKQLTCRTLIHICREITYKQADIDDRKQLINIIFSHYNSQNQTITLDDIASIFRENIDFQLLNKLKNIEKISSTTRDDILKALQVFYDKIKKKEYDLSFKFSEFLAKLNQLQFKDYEIVIENLTEIKNFVKRNIKYIKKPQLLFIASFNNLNDLVFEINSIYKKSRVFNLQCLDSAEVRNKAEFSTVIFKCQLLSYLSENGFYPNQIPEIFIDTQFAQNYFKCVEQNEDLENSVKSKFSIILKPPINFKIPYQWDKRINPMQQICSSLFKFKNCSLLYKGLMNDLFINTFLIYESNDFKQNVNWINWMNQFFDCFMNEKIITNFTISFNEFNQILNSLLNNRNTDFLMKMMNQLDLLKQLPNDLIKTNSINKIYNAISSLNLKDVYIEVSENNAMTNKFFEIKENLEKMKDRNVLQINFLNKYMKLISQNLNQKNIKFLENVNNSLQNINKTQQTKEENKLTWPTIQTIGQNIDKVSPNLDSLIAYSHELEILNNIDLNMPNLLSLYELSFPDQLLIEFITKQQISNKTITLYKSILNAQLLYDIFNCDIKSVKISPSKKGIIDFFNSFIDRNIQIDPDWLIIANNLSMNHSFNSVISIPTFSPIDMLSLFVNPLTQEPGVMLQNIKVDKELIRQFYEIFDLIQDNQSFNFLNENIFQAFVKYFDNKYPDHSFDLNDADFFNEVLEEINEDDNYSNVHDLCNTIQSFLLLIEYQQPTNSLNFNDIEQINFNDYDSYINANPSIGFYVTCFPDVINNHIELLRSLCSESNKNDKFPLALLEFRVFSRNNCIQFYLPSNFPSIYAEEFQDMVANSIISNIKKITNFSNLIGFLLPKVPKFIKNTYYSEYLRNVVINFVTIPKENMLLIEIKKILKQFLPEIIAKLGSSEWNELINQELKYEKSENTNKMFMSFLTNPWLFILDNIDENIKKEFEMNEFEVRTSVDQILKMILNISSKSSIDNLIECVKKDESSLQNKLGDNMKIQHDNNHKKATNNKDQIRVFFGSFLINDLIEKLQSLNNKYEKFKVDNYYMKNEVLEEMQSDVIDLEQYTKISFSIDNVEKPHNTNEFLSNNLLNLINSAKNNLLTSRYDLFNENYIKKYDFFIGKKNEFQVLLKKSQKFSVQPKSNSVVVQDREIDKLEPSNILLSPSIFKNGDELKVTIKEIKIHISNLLFGVDLTPLQIRLCNFSKEDINCTFEQNNRDLPSPIYRNQAGFLFIEIPIESVCKNANKYKDLSKSTKNGVDIEYSFIFEGKINLFSISNPSNVVQIPYSVILDYISITAFVKIQNERNFAIKNGKADVIPFLAGPETHINFEKFMNRPFNDSFLLDNIIELNDNKALRPTFRSQKDRLNKNVCLITSSLSESKFENSYLSMNYEFGLSKDTRIPVGIHINTNSLNNRFYLSIFSDSDSNFVESGGIINIGNLPRKVYFFIGYSNLKNEPLKPSNIKMESDNYFIHSTFNEDQNKGQLEPNKIGHVIYFFESSYSGFFPKEKRDSAKGSITVEIDGSIQKIDFTYIIKSMEFIEKKFTNNDNKILYYYDDDSYNKLDTKNLSRSNIWKLENRLIISSLGFCFNSKNDSFVHLRYNSNEELKNISDTDQSFEVLEFSNRRFSSHPINKKDILSARGNLYLFARFKGKPETFFPLFGVNDIRQIFDSRKISQFVAEKDFWKFYYQLLSSDDRENNQKDSLDGNTRLNNVTRKNYSYIIYTIRKELKNIQFKECLNTIVNFTNCHFFNEHYEQSLRHLTSNTKDKKFQFLSFISALNEVVYSRFAVIKACGFYIQFPVELDDIKSQREKIFEEEFGDMETIESCKFLKTFHDMTKNDNNIEADCQDNYKKSGFTITPILKWTEINGLSSSDEKEYSKFKKLTYEIESDIKSIPNSVANTNISENVENISFPKKATIKSIYETFDKILESTYILTFTTYSLKQNGKPLKDIKMLLNTLISVFEWQKESAVCFPFSSFTDNFKPSFISMMARLKMAKLKISKFDYDSIDTKDFDKFVQIPTFNEITYSYSKFTQPGNEIAVPDSKTESIKIHQEKNKPEEKAKKPEEKAFIENKRKANEIIFYGSKEVNVEIQVIPTKKKIDFRPVSKEGDEIPDTDFIQYLIQEMMNYVSDPNEKIVYKQGSYKHNPRSIQNLNVTGSHNPRIDSFIEASKKLSDTMCTEVINSIQNDNFQNNLLTNKDTIYSSILVDCSSSFSTSQKAAIVTMAISLANALTSMKIPYSIIIFCEENFQYILKNVDDNHDSIHFEKLLDTIIIRRRMPDIGSAILMADAEIKPRDKKRIYHSIFVLTDGLTKKIKLIDQWKNNVLNSAKKSIMFFFLDILTNKKDRDRVYPIWTSFQEGIKYSKSPNSVIYVKTSSIYNGDPNIAKSFIDVLTRFPVSEYSVDKENIEPQYADPISFITKDQKSIKNFFNNIIEEIQKGVVDEKKFYAQCSFPQEVLEQFSEIEFNVVQPNPLESFSAGIGEIDQKIIINFIQQLLSFSNSFIDNSLYQEIGSLVFPLNKPSQYSPSENGNIFYFPGLIKYMLTQGQDSKIFLEKKSGLIRSHSVFIVIDNSVSCFNIETLVHSYQTLFTLLYPLSKVDIPSLNLIITTDKNPVILCSEKPTMTALSNDSPLWASLFYHLSKPHTIGSCLYKALMTAYQIRIQQKTKASVLFILSDGFYNYNDRNEFKGIFDALITMNTIPITIGIGLNPYFINLMTDKAIWSQNPRYIWSAILYLYGKECNKFDTIKSSFTISDFSNENVNILEQFLSPDKLYFKELYKELNCVMRSAISYKSYYNESQNNPLSVSSSRATQLENKNDDNNNDNSDLQSDIKEVTEDVKNAVGDQYDLGKKNYYQGVKLLIMMCWDCTCSKQEDKQISEDVLRNGIDEKHISVVNALRYFGIETKIVKDYIDAINEIKDGIYSQVWVICGRMDGTMPGKKKPENNSARYIDQFIDCLIMFWNRGGGIVFWTDNYPLTAEVNKFLEKAKFKVPKKLNQSGYDEINVNFHIGGNYPGAEMMKRQNSITINSSNCSFEGNSVSSAVGYQKELFNHELYVIFEGLTISSAIKGNERNDEWKNYKNMPLQFASNNDVYPFIPFSKSSSGGFSSLYYMSPLDIDNGDIVIDCGFSKLFFELTKDGIDRYVKNIAVWMLQLEKKDIKFGAKKDPRLVTPEKFNFDINEDQIQPTFHKFKEKGYVDLVFLIDSTGSMRYCVRAVRDSCNDIANQCYEKFPGKVFRFGAVAYKDTVVSEEMAKCNPNAKEIEKVEFCQLDKDPEKIKEFFGSLRTFGGGDDGPEDWVSGYDCLLHNIKWKPEAVKIVIHICDAQGHGTRFTCDQKYKSFFYKIPCFYEYKEKGKQSDDSDEQSDDSDEQNESEIEKKEDEIYKQIQEDQDTKFEKLIQEAAERGLIFFCLNKHKKSMYCFAKTRELFKEKGGKVFVIQNQIPKRYNKRSHRVDDDDDDDDNEDENSEEDENENLVDQVKQIAKDAIDISVAVSNSNKIENDYEKKCNERFEKDFANFQKEISLIPEEIFKRNNHVRYLKQNKFGKYRERVRRRGWRRGRSRGRGRGRGRDGRGGKNNGEDSRDEDNITTESQTTPQLLKMQLPISPFFGETGDSLKLIEDNKVPDSRGRSARRRKEKRGGDSRTEENRSTENRGRHIRSRKEKRGGDSRTEENRTEENRTEENRGGGHNRRGRRGRGRGRGRGGES